jgi:hypothetical protein
LQGKRRAVVHALRIISAAVDRWVLIIVVPRLRQIIPCVVHLVLFMSLLMSLFQFYASYATLVIICPFDSTL